MGIRKRRRAAAKAPLNRSYDHGYNVGYNAGHSEGYGLGFRKGAEAWATGFDGTSIVIPSYNQKTYLADCIDSIRASTPERHEVIVIDNGSTDGTADYLRSLKRENVRYKICERNLGFAGGVNQGLMMARGSTLMFLNNDTIVTDNWLSNLLVCLHDNDRYGLVGPVTNYISGEQQIETAYQSTDEMHRFAQSFNRSDRGKWQTTDRLTGFCVLMTRSVFRRIGYLDEGFEIGNCEDDDYGYRSRLLGLELVIAKDSFIHHVGSTTIKTLTPEQFEEMYARNLAFYSDKWGETGPLLQEAASHWGGGPLSANDFYPTHVTVQGPGSRLYWIEHGVRRPLAHCGEIAATRLSQVELKNWPEGAVMSGEEWESRQAELAASASGAGPVSDGSLVQTPDGRLLQYRCGRLHRLATHRVAEAWGLNSRPVRPLSQEEADAYSSGTPLIAPPVLKAGNL